ncbi:MAG: hypothetical protein C4341_01565 [Armatimonadota bacterium]
MPWHVHKPDASALPFLSDTARRAPVIEAFGTYILDLVQSETPYWGELPQHILQQVLCAERVESAFDEAVRTLGVPHLSDYALDIERRAAWTAIFSDLYAQADAPPRGTEIGPPGLALDVGAGFGANTLFLAQRFNTVVATDVVIERLAFIGRRCEARGLTNVLLVRADFESVPLRPAVADFVVCNGVLEWVGAMDDHGNPEERQAAFLRALALSLKPKGRLYIGIENRFGLPMWRGAPDHSGLPFTSLMPRPIANAVVRVAHALRARTAHVGHYTRQRAYRTYTHSPAAWHALLREAGLQHIRVFGADDYNRTRIAFPIAQPGSTQALRIMRSEAPRPPWLNNVLASLTCRIPAALLIHASPRETEGAEEQVRRWLQHLATLPTADQSTSTRHPPNATLLLLDTRSADAGVVRYLLALHTCTPPGPRRKANVASPSLLVLTRMPQDAALTRSFRRVRLPPDGEPQETEAPATQVPGKGTFLLEPLRNPPSLLAELRLRKPPITEWLADIAQYPLRNLLRHLAFHERRWTAEDTTRLIALAPEPFVEAQTLKETARRLEGATLRFGAAHGDLAPENLFRDGGTLVVDDWNETVMNAPVAMDAAFFAATSAWAVSENSSVLGQALAAIRPALTPDEFSHREHLLALALLHWRSLRIPSLEEWAKRRVSSVHRLLGV